MSNPHKHHITLVGCGKMGTALLSGWLKSGINAEYVVIDPYAPPFENITHLKKIEDISSLKAPDDVFYQTDMFILAVKPQIMGEVISTLAPLRRGPATILSIAAGQPIANFQDIFGPTAPIIRAMPNTPAAIGRGMTVAVANDLVTSEHKELADTLLKCSGKVEWIINESLMDAITAVSGSGPAYIFYLIDVLTQAAEKAGLDSTLATELARETVIGAAALAEAEHDKPAALLRENVTSPRGTTAAAMEVLMDGRMQGIFDEAIEAAKKRSIELRKPR